MLPVAFTDPIWLWLLLPALALVVVGWLAAARTLPGARRVASLIVRLALVVCLVGALAGARLALPSDRLSVVFLVDASASMVDATREELLDFAQAAVEEMPEGDTAGVVVFGANALVDRFRPRWATCSGRHRSRWSAPPTSPRRSGWRPPSSRRARSSGWSC